MKKKNGFIATSLIYSFFLIFITLFLTIIADYLQDKVLLNTIEDGIKTDLNNQMTINDFELGDYVTSTTKDDNVYVVAKIYINNDSNNNHSNDKKEIVLYEVYHETNKANFLNEISSTVVGESADLLETMDETTKNKILFFSKKNGSGWSNCSKNSELLNDLYYKCDDSDVSFQRERYILELNNKKIKKETGTEGTLNNPFKLTVTP